mmetsp:Transcript_49313/g.130696  ORF Transcript_49313/g.130696 Transcript_49313/m.130696 type:complete len:220 (-) Transcript_49313:397-1056(-)
MCSWLSVASLSSEDATSETSTSNARAFDSSRNRTAPCRTSSTTDTAHPGVSGAKSKSGFLDGRTDSVCDQLLASVWRFTVGFTVSRDTASDVDGRARACATSRCLTLDDVARVCDPRPSAGRDPPGACPLSTRQDSCELGRGRFDGTHGKEAVSTRGAGALARTSSEPTRVAAFGRRRAPLFTAASSTSDTGPSSCVGFSIGASVSRTAAFAALEESPG